MTSFCKLQGSLTLATLVLATGLVPAQNPAAREIEAMAASSPGSGVALAVNDDPYGASQLFFFSPPLDKVLWQLAKLPTIGSVAISPDGNTVAVGLVAVTERDFGVLLLDARSGKQLGGLGADKDSYFIPGLVYPRFGSGVSQLTYSADGALLYGLSNDTLFAWDVVAKKYLWNVDVPDYIEAPADLPDPLPYGHATDFVLSPDGRQIAALRDLLQITNAGRIKPRHFIKRGPNHDLVIETAVFSTDSRILAAGEYGTLKDGKTVFQATDMWIDGAVKPAKIIGCGGNIAWTGAPDVFACQNDSGSHLRNIHDPQKDIGSASPSGDLPILKVGNSLWSSAYKRSDWKDPTKSLSLTLVELGTSRQVTLALPGRGK